MTSRRVVITGASGGIGRATALLFRERGWDVTATARKDADLARLRDDGFTAVRLELADAASVAAAADAIIADGAPRVLVNNAGFGLVKPMEDTTRDEWDALLAANVVGPFDLARRVLPAMRAAGGGRVITVGSIVGREGLPFFGAYAAAKAAAATASDAFRVEARASRVHVSLIEPGPATTGFAPTALAPIANGATAAGPYANAHARLTRFESLLHKGMTPERVARVIHRTATRRRPPARVPVGAIARLATWKHALPAPARRVLYAWALSLRAPRKRPPS